ncbi:MAG: gliding motility-associated-like protein [Bacteroidia bacterium]|jgi:gliding motility-associated-like protein
MIRISALYIITLLIYQLGYSQVIVGNGGILSTQDQSLVFLNQTNLVNNGLFDHSGTLTVLGSITNNDSLVCATNSANTILLDQDWTNNGDYSSGDGRVVLNGTDQIIGGSMESSFYDLILEGQIGETKTAQTSVTVKDSLILTNSELALLTNTLTLSKASISVARDTGYISTDFPGKVIANLDVVITTDIEIPLGFSLDEDDYRPITLKAPRNGLYEFALYGNNPSIDGFDESQLNDSICRIQDDYYYYVKTSSEALDYTLKLTSDEDIYTKLAFWESSEWEKLTNSNDLLVTEMEATQNPNKSYYLALGVEQPFAYAGEDAIDRDGGNYVLQGDGYLSKLSFMTWSPDKDLSCSDCFKPVLTFGEAGLFVLTVDNGIGCVDRDTVEIIHLREEVFTENAFTPNNDNLNEIFKPKLLSNETLVNIEVYSRWGHKVYEGIDGWDGTYMGSIAPQGAYIYLLTVDQRLLEGQKQIYYSKGTLTLLR